jgi:hypothetical protein
MFWMLRVVIVVWFLCGGERHVFEIERMIAV